MKSLHMLWGVLLVLPATACFGYSTDGGSGGRRVISGGSRGSSSGGAGFACTIRSGVLMGPNGRLLYGQAGLKEYMRLTGWKTEGTTSPKRSTAVPTRGRVGAMGSLRGRSTASPGRVGATGPTRRMAPPTTGSKLPSDILRPTQVDYSRLAIVEWGYSVRAMKALQETMEQPFAIFFCSEETAKYTGGGKEAFQKYIQSFPSRPTHTTVFDERTTVRALQAAGLQRFVRVPTTPENSDLMRSYGAPVGSETLVICGYNGDALITLCGEQCVQSQVTGAMKDFPKKYEAWKIALQDKRANESQAQHPRGTMVIKKWE